MKEQQLLTNEQWAVALALFADVVESGDPERMIASQGDEWVRLALENLWFQHQQADKFGFLEDDLTISVEPTALAEDVFAPEEILDGRFTVLRVLGRGGMGEVYLAADKISSEMVALKTIKRELDRDETNRIRFRAEVYNSRRVTHQNVCRIFDIFEHHGTPFYSMKYLAGLTLAEILAVGPISPERGKSLAIQLAEGLSAAHKEGILHCDFKPANVIVERTGNKERAVITDFGLARALDRTDAVGAGTLFYMAPELRRGQPPTVQTDIYAFGKVLEALVPKHRLAAECQAEDPHRRPESMEAIHKELLGGISRRQILLGGVLLGGATGWIIHSIPAKAPIPLGSQQRVKVNGFVSQWPETAQTVRNLFIMALRQSPLVSVLGDTKYQAPGNSKTLNAGIALPLADLLQIAAKQKASLVIAGDLEKKGNGLQLTIQVYEPSDSRPRYSNQVHVGDPRQIVLLAEDAARDLRLKGFGESSLHSTYMPLEQVTSAQPEALDCYFRAIALYEKDEGEAALMLLDRAISLDPNFVLGYHYRALALIAQDELEKAIAPEEIARTNRRRVTERERNWIEGQFANLIRAFDQSAEAFHKNTVLFPDEAFFQRQHAFALMRLGRYAEAIVHNRTAVELDPFSDANVSELLTNLAEANRIEDFFVEIKAQEKSFNHIHRANALAYLQAGDYEKTLSELRLFGQGAIQLASESRLESVAPLVMQGRLAEAILWIQSDLGGPAAPNEHTYTRHNDLGQLHRLQGNPGAAAEEAEYLVNLPSLATSLIHLREGCALAFELKETALLVRGLDNLSGIFKKWPSAHSQSAVWATQAMVKHLAGEQDAGDLFAKAKVEWPDPINLIYVARWEGETEKLHSQHADLVEVERLRGKIYKYHFAGLVVLNWLESARCLRRLSLVADSLRMYERVLSHWGASGAATALISEARRERDELKRRST